MTEEEILARARELMNRHGLEGWRACFDGARRRAGCCFYQRQTISLSRVLLPTYPASAVDEVILHEIAHALVGPVQGHNAVWKAMAARIGATPRARLAGQLPTPEALWVGTCPRCGATRQLYRAPRRVVSCGGCSATFDSRFLLSWTLRGEPAHPGGPFAQEMAQLRRLRA